MQCYSRFVHLYDQCCSMSGILQEVSEQVNVHIHRHPKLKWDAMRYLASSVRVTGAKACISPPGWRVRAVCARLSRRSEREAPGFLVSSQVCFTYFGAHVSGYTRLEWKPDDDHWHWLTSPFVVNKQSHSAADNDGFDSVRPQDSLVCPPLLTKKEVELLQHSPDVQVSLQTWAMRSIAIGYGDPDVDKAKPSIELAEDAVLRLRRAIAAIRNTLSMQVRTCRLRISVMTRRLQRKRRCWHGLRTLVPNHRRPGSAIARIRRTYRI
eukprot:scaffold167534_cov33-Tisochrysis_lutea.AAC.1